MILCSWEWESGTPFDPVIRDFDLVSTCLQIVDELVDDPYEITVYTRGYHCPLAFRLFGWRHHQRFSLYDRTNWGFLGTGGGQNKEQACCSSLEHRGHEVLQLSGLSVARRFGSARP